MQSVKSPNSRTELGYLESQKIILQVWYYSHINEQLKSLSDCTVLDKYNGLKNYSLIVEQSIQQYLESTITFAYHRLCHVTQFASFETSSANFRSWSSFQHGHVFTAFHRLALAFPELNWIAAALALVLCWCLGPTRRTRQWCHGDAF